jgi:hypothetical protein
MIQPQAYSDSYNTLWTQIFKNVSSNALRDSWKTLATAFNDCIVDNTESREVKRRVVSMPTGSGKTTGLAHYMQMLPGDTKAIIIVFFTDSADELEEVINKYTPGKAIAIHSKNGTKLTDINEQQVLIITHAHYIIHMFNDHLKERDLIVIDEAIDLLKESSINNESLRRLKTVLDSVIHKYPDSKAEYEKIGTILNLSQEIQKQINVINDKYKALFDISNEEDTSKLPLLQKREHIVDRTVGYEYINLNSLRKIIKIEDCLRISTGKSGAEHQESEFKRKLNDYITNIEGILKDWFYYYGTNLETSSLNSVSIKLPNKSVVVLDATATTNHLYKLFPDVVLYPDEANARNYSNVDLYLARGLKTGKSGLLENPKESADSLIENLKETLPREAKVLIVTIMDLEAHLTKYELPFEYEVNHFGNLTGKNDWKDFDTVVIYGLMHKPETFSINRQAVSTKFESIDEETGVVTEYIDVGDKKVRKLLIETDLASEIIQAVNRVRCRNVIDEDGNCDDTKIYLTLPPGDIGETILSSMINKMKNINIKDWDFNTKLTRTSSKRSSHVEPVIQYIDSYLKDDVTYIKATKVKDVLEIPTSTYTDLCKSSAFLEALEEAKFELKLPNGVKRGLCFYRLV